MISEVVIFPIPKDMTREQVISLCEKSGPTWRANPDLIHKSFLYDSETRRGGSVYLWKNIEAAKQSHDSKWCARMAEVFWWRAKIRLF